MLRIGGRVENLRVGGCRMKLGRVESLLIVLLGNLPQGYIGNKINLEMVGVQKEMGGVFRISPYQTL